MKNFYVVRADQPRESPIYQPYALRFAWSEKDAENPTLKRQEREEQLRKPVGSAYGRGKRY